MEIIDNLELLTTSLDQNTPLGLTIGNFDGLHLGHRHLILSILKDCFQEKLKLVVITFNPHPKKVLRPNSKNYLINDLQSRREYLSGLGIEYLVELNFTRDFSDLSPKEFMENYILNNNSNK